jgi:hypothetical protein
LLDTIAYCQRVGGQCFGYPSFGDPFLLPTLFLADFQLIIPDPSLIVRLARIGFEDLRFAREV